MIFPDEVIKAVEASNTERVLFLAMSTLPGLKSVITYESKELQGNIFKGISQLEAGSKYFFQKLAKENKAIDRVVVIATEATLKGNGAYSGKSAVEVYKLRLNEFLTEGTSKTCFDCEDKRPEILEEPFIGKKLYDSGSFEEKIIVIESDGVERLWDARQAILGDSGKRIDLYIDMQGGDRNSIPLFNTVIDLLKDKSVNVVERVAIPRFSPNTINELETVNDMYRTYELVTAYQIFKRYGWGNPLKEYFRGHEEKPIVNAIEHISEAIKLCNVEGFDEGLENLYNSIKEWKSKEKAKANSEMDFVVDLIEEDFSELLEYVGSGKKRMKYVNQIRWCIKKNFIQQAVTIFESKMPREFVWNGISYYCDENDDKERIMAEFDRLFSKASDSEKHKLIDINHYWIKDCHNTKFGTLVKKHFEITFAAEKECKNASRLVKGYKEICEKRNAINHAAERSRSDDGFANRHWNEFKKTGKFKVKELEKFLDSFENEANSIPDEIKDSVVDLA